MVHPPSVCWFPPFLRATYEIVLYHLHALSLEIFLFLEYSYWKHMKFTGFGIDVIFRDSDQHQMQYGHIHSKSLPQTICSIFVLMIL